MFFLKFKEFLRIIKQGGENMKKKNNMWDSEMPDLSESMRMPNLFESMQPRPRPPVRPYPSPYPRRTVVVRPRIVYRQARSSGSKPLLTRQQIQTGKKYAQTGIKYAQQGYARAKPIIQRSASIANQVIQRGLSRVKERVHSYQESKRTPWSFEKKHIRPSHMIHNSPFYKKVKEHESREPYHHTKKEE